MVVVSSLSLLVGLSFAAVYPFFRAGREERRFNEFFVCLLLYELGDDPNPSLTVGILRKILPCHPEEADELIADLLDRKIIELTESGGVYRVRIGPKAAPPPDRPRFEEALVEARHKLLLERGVIAV